MAEIGTARFLFVLRDPVDRLWAQIGAGYPRDQPRSRTPQDRGAGGARGMPTVASC
ncbi:MAG: hypothetical protein IPF96_21305 [Rhodobacter sp.]|nr:hypothetical protein [Rhodobacter sp.]